MSTLSLTNVNSGATILAAHHNTQNSEITAWANGNIDATNIADSGVTTAKIANEAVTPAKLNADAGSTWASQTWSPTWTNLTIGDGTAEYKHSIIGNIVVFKVTVTLGSTSSISGAPTFTLPQTAETLSVANIPIGQARLLDASGSVNPGVVLLSSTTVAGIIALDANSTFPRESAISSTNPFTWTTSDKILLTGWYWMA